MRSIMLIFTLCTLVACGAFASSEASIALSMPAGHTPVQALVTEAIANASTASDPGATDLQEQLNRMVTGWAGRHAVSITDLQTGQTIAVNGTEPQLAACTIKIALMMAVAQDIDAGRYTAADVADLVQAAMGPSATAPARALLARVGRGDIGTGIRRVNDLMANLGMSGSLLTHPPGYFWEEYGYTDSHGISDNLLTANDLTLLLGKLYRGEALSPTATNYVLWSMTLAPNWMDRSLGSALSDGAPLSQDRPTL